jgi:putative PIN family toxin of toxin-antitoxin system
MIKVVYDTNIIMSGYIWEGNERRCIKKVEENKVMLFLSEEIILEIYNVAKRGKFSDIIKEVKLTPDMLVRKILDMSEIVESKRRTDVVLEDPKDIKFIECAIAAKAPYIVSGDSHLLKLKKFEEIEIVTSKEFLSRIKV